METTITRELTGKKNKKKKYPLLIHGKSQRNSYRSMYDIDVITRWIRYAWRYQTEKETNL